MRLRTQWVQSAAGLPVCCTRHGRAATASGEFAARRVPAALVAVAGAAIALAVFVFGERVVARTWPFCDECRDEWALRLTVGSSLCAVAPLPYIALLATAPVAGFSGADGTPALLSGAIGALLLTTGLAFTGVAAWQSLCGVLLSRDGEWLTVPALLGARQ